MAVFIFFGQNCDFSFTSQEIVSLSLSVTALICSPSSEAKLFVSLSFVLTSVLTSFKN